MSTIKTNVTGLLANNDLVSTKIESAMSAINAGDLVSAKAILTEVKVRSAATSSGLSTLVANGLEPMGVGLNQLGGGQGRIRCCRGEEVNCCSKTTK